LNAVGKIVILHIHLTTINQTACVPFSGFLFFKLYVEIMKVELFTK